MPSPPRPAVASRYWHVTVKPGYSMITSCVSGTSQLSLRNQRPPRLYTDFGAFTPSIQCTKSSECCPRFVACPPE